jgi:ribosomal protein L37AE/L43A
MEHYSNAYQIMISIPNCIDQRKHTCPDCGKRNSIRLSELLCGWHCNECTAIVEETRNIFG